MRPMSTDAAEVSLGGLYLDTHDRLVVLLGELDSAELDRPVPACPGWSVFDVVAHLTAVAQDILAGRLTSPPTDQETAAQVARFRGRPFDQLLAEWDTKAGPLAEMVSAARAWPAVSDIAAHEQDIRAATDRPGARDSDVVRLCSARLVTGLRPPVPVRVTVEDAEFFAGPDGPLDGADTEVLALRTTRFEAFRWRLGRRSRGQLVALDWSSDPAAVIDHLAIFGPSPIDIIE